MTTQPVRPPTCPGWHDGTFTFRLVNSHGEHTSRVVPASILDGLAVHVVAWDSEDSKEPRHTLSVVACGLPAVGSYISIGKAKAKAMAARIVGLAAWPVVRDFPGGDVPGPVEEAARSVYNQVGEWLDWPYGWQKPAIPHVEPETAGEAAVRYASARRSFLMLAAIYTDMIPRLRHEQERTRASLARILGPSNHVDRDGRRYETDEHGGLAEDRTGEIGGALR